MGQQRKDPGKRAGPSAGVAKTDGGAGSSRRPPSLAEKLGETTRPAKDQTAPPPLPAASSSEPKGEGPSAPAKPASGPARTSTAPPPTPPGTTAKNTPKRGTKAQPAAKKSSQKAVGRTSTATKPSAPPLPSAKAPTPATPAPPTPSAPARSSATATARAPAAALSATPDRIEPTLSAPKPSIDPAPPVSETTSDAAPSPDDQSPRRKAKRRPAGPSRAQIAANDDSPSIGGLIYALNQKPSDRPFVLAAIGSAIWLVIGLAVGYVVIAPELVAATTLADFLRQTSLFTTAASIFGPIALFWFLAFLAWRSEEMHLRSTAMTEVAVRLTEPDRIAEQHIASLGQVVRREVNYMNEAVAQALNRANELDALMQSEVGALERSYDDNERKIRSLLQELASERNALTSTGVHFRQTLEHLAQDVPALIERLSDQQSKLAGLVAGAGENLTTLEQSLSGQTDRLQSTLETRTEQMRAMLTAQTDSVETTLGSFTEALAVGLDQRNAKINETIEDRTREVTASFEQGEQRLNRLLTDHKQTVEAELDRRMQSVEEVISKRTETLQNVFEEYSLALDTTLANRAAALDTQLVERTKSLDDAFNDRLRLFDEAIARSTTAIDSAIGENAKTLTSAMEVHATELSDRITKQAGQLDKTLLTGISQVRQTSENISRQSIRAIEGLAGQADLLKTVSENLLGQINTVTTRFENQGQAILKSANALESANYKIDKALGQRTEDLNATLDRLSSKATAIGDAAVGYSSQIEGHVNDAEKRTRLLTQELSREAESRSRDAIDQISRLKSEAIKEQDRALGALKNEFETVAREVTDRLGVLSEQFSLTTGEVRSQARRAAEEIQSDQARLRAHIEELPTATRENTEAMRRALRDQIRALDQLTQFARDTGVGRNARPPLTGPTPQPADAGGAPGQNPLSGRALTNVSSAIASDLARITSGATGTRQSAPAKDAASNAWSVGDLLARASLEDDANDTDTALDVAAIAKAIDPSLASAIWTRFRSGQRGFMVASIYPPDGRELFAETQQRYGASARFRNNVDQFLSDFEGVLKTSDARDPSGETSKVEVLSETGRVYLFLSHASGRLT